MKLSSKIKFFFGIFEIIEFALRQKLPEDLKLVLDSQVSKFNVVRRLFKHIDVKGSHGYTNFYTMRLGKNTSLSAQDKKFPNTQPEYLLCSMNIKDANNLIKVNIWTVEGVLFAFDYHSSDHIYFPKSDNYTIRDIELNL